MLSLPQLGHDVTLPLTAVVVMVTYGGGGAAITIVYGGPPTITCYGIGCIIGYPVYVSFVT